jgi:hypothetical protein
MIHLTQAEYDELCARARAWDDHVKRRLTEGYTRAKCTVTCVEGAATLRFSDTTIITPFGSALVKQFPDGFHDFKVKPGVELIVDNEVKLSIS